MAVYEIRAGPERALQVAAPGRRGGSATLIRLPPLLSTSWLSRPLGAGRPRGEPSQRPPPQQGRVMVDERPVLLRTPAAVRWRADLEPVPQPRSTHRDGGPVAEVAWPARARAPRLRERWSTGLAQVEPWQASKPLMARYSLIDAGDDARRILPARQLLAGGPGRVGQAAAQSRRRPARGNGWRSAPAGRRGAHLDGRCIRHASRPRAPPVVQTIGRPRAMASASAMP